MKGLLLAAALLTPVADGVWVALQPHDGRFDDSNATVIVREEGVIVVDAQSDADFVGKLVAEIRARTAAPVRWLVYTHWHPDHTQGAALYREAFGDALTIVAHESVAADISLADGDARVLRPTLTYTDTLQLRGGRREVRLIHVQAHTGGDTLVHLPAESLLIAGDVVDDLPFAGHGHPRAWLGALDRIEDLGAATIVPGHGPLLRDGTKLAAIRAYLEAVVDHVDAQKAAGATLEAAQSSFDGAAVRRGLAGDDAGAQRFFDATVGDAIAAAWNETD